MGWFKHHLFFFVKGQRFADPNSWSPPKTWDWSFWGRGGCQPITSKEAPWFEKPKLWRNRVVPKRLNQLLIHVRYFVKRHKGRCRCPLFIFKVDFTLGILLTTCYYSLLISLWYILDYMGISSPVWLGWDNIRCEKFHIQWKIFNKHVMLRCSFVFFLRWFLFVVSCRHGQTLCEKYCWWFRNPANQLRGSWSYDLQGFSTIPGG